MEGTRIASAAAGGDVEVFPGDVEVGVVGDGGCADLEGGGEVEAVVVLFGLLGWMGGFGRGCGGFLFVWV